MSDKVPLSMPEISRRLKQMPLPAIDVVVGVGSGGVVPASLAAFLLERPLAVLHINFRAPDNSPRRPAPELLAPFTPLAPGTRVLLVDDVSVSGKTLTLAREQLPGCRITTLVLKGQGDLVVFPEVSSCVHWPWKDE